MGVGTGTGVITKSNKWKHTVISSGYDDDDMDDDDDDDDSYSIRHCNERQVVNGVYAVFIKIKITLFESGRS